MTHFKDLTLSETNRFQPSEQDVALARQLFFEQGKTSLSPVLNDRVMASWQRCHEQGLAVDRPLCAIPVSDAALKDARACSEALRLLAEPEMEFLTEALSNTCSQIILSDPHGLILDTRGDSQAMDRATREALLPGVSWSERDMGTNAIGTALMDNHLIEVWGNEHYHHQHRHICCTAAPIVDHTGNVVGLLDVSGDARLPRGYATSLIRRSVREIEHRWVSNAPRRFIRLNLNPSRACIGSYQEGVLLLDEDSIAGANRCALHWLNADWSLIGKRLQDLFDLAGSSRDFSTLRLHDGRSLYGSIERAANQERTVSRISASRPQSPHPSEHFPGDAAPEWLSATHRVELGRTVRAVNAGLSTIVLGETGCGKEVFSRLVHARSSRASGPFVAINCAALPENLIEAELFGYSEGAFTGASRKGAKGRILEANGGILFLDEIGDMPLTLQARLLRVLQDRKVTPLGGGVAREVDCVVMSATHRDLGVMVEKGAFRADLFYRLRDHEIVLPAFRSVSAIERRHAVEWLWHQNGGPRNGMSLSDRALDALLSHSWPGNLRQLDSVLKALVALSEAGVEIGLNDLPRELRQTADSVQEPLPSLREHSDEVIEAALIRHRGKVAAAARELGIHRATLYRRMRSVSALSHARTTG